MKGELFNSVSVTTNSPALCIWVSLLGSLPLKNCDQVFFKFGFIYAGNGEEEKGGKYELEVDWGNLFWYLLKGSGKFSFFIPFIALPDQVFWTDTTLRDRPYHSRRGIQSGNDHQTRGYWNNEKKWIKGTKPAHGIGIRFAAKTQ